MTGEELTRKRVQIINEKRFGDLSEVSAMAPHRHVQTHTPQLKPSHHRPIDKRKRSCL